MKVHFPPLFNKILLIALWLSLLLTLVGGIIYLVENGHKQINFAQSDGIALTIILSGILALIFTQFLRLFLVAVYFWKIKEKKFIFFTLFIFILLSVSFFISY